MTTVAGKRVLMLLENAPYLLDSRVYPEATTLAAAGYQVAVICPGAITERWHQTINSVQVYRFPVIFEGSGALGYLIEYGYALVAAFVLSWVVLWRHGFDVIHAHNPPDTFVFIGAIFKLLGKRFIYDQHDLAPEMYAALFEGGRLWVSRLLLWLERLSCRRADRVIVTNQSFKQVNIERSRIPAERISVVRNGPNLTRLQPVEPIPGLRQNGKTTLCYIGVMGRHDGVDYLLRALHHLVTDLRRTDFFCVLVGAGGAFKQMKTLSEQLQLGDYVRFAGWVKPAEVGPYLSAADICVAPEPSNVYNDRCTVIKIAEYMAMGKPVVAFDLPEHRVTAGAAALYAQPNDELDFAQKLARLMDEPEERRRMGQLGRSRVETELAWAYQAQHLLAVYESLGAQAHFLPNEDLTGFKNLSGLDN